MSLCPPNVTDVPMRLRQPPEVVVCNTCGDEVLFESLPNNKQAAWGKRLTCTPCYRSYQREKRAAVPREDKQKYARQWWLSSKGLTVQEYEDMTVLQGGGCAICGAAPSEKNLHIDHNHNCCDGRSSCGKCIRGLLCGPCNQGLGQFRDDPARLRAAANYLESR